MAAEPGGGRSRPYRCYRPLLTAFTAALLLGCGRAAGLSPASSSSCQHRAPGSEEVGPPRGFLRRSWGLGGPAVPRSPLPLLGPGRAVRGPAPRPPPPVWSVASLRAAGGRGAACVRRRAGRGCASKRAERCSGLGAPARVAVRVSRLIQRLVPLPARLSIRFL